MLFIATFFGQTVHISGNCNGGKAALMDSFDEKQAHTVYKVNQRFELCSLIIR